MDTLTIVAVHIPQAIGYAVVVSTSIDAVRLWLAGEFAESDVFPEDTEREILTWFDRVSFVARAVASGLSGLRGKR